MSTIQTNKWLRGALKELFLSHYQTTPPYTHTHTLYCRESLISRISIWFMLWLNSNLAEKNKYSSKSSGSPHLAYSRECLSAAYPPYTCTHVRTHVHTTPHTFLTSFQCSLCTGFLCCSCSPISVCHLSVSLIIFTLICWPIFKASFTHPTFSVYSKAKYKFINKSWKCSPSFLMRNSLACLETQSKQNDHSQWWTTKMHSYLDVVFACHACFYMFCTCSVFLEKAWAPRVNMPLGDVPFSDDCSWTPKTLQIIMCHESLLLHWGLSWSSVLSLTAFQRSHPCLWQGMWIHGLHLCLITTTDGSVTDVSFCVCDGSHSFFAYSYCQHAFTSSSCGLYSPLHRYSSHCMPFTWCLQLCSCCQSVYRPVLLYTGYVLF